METLETLANIASASRQATDQPDQQPTATLTSDHVVLFADMLGFAALTESNPVDVRMLHARTRPLSIQTDDILIGSKNPLTRAFSAFHSSLKWSIMLAEMKHRLTAITFSDSVFIATAYLFEATDIAIDLAQSMLAQKVPVRMGIAFGSFAALRFRSEISADGGDHAAQFLGTAVVRAYQAEKCGIKGMRIFLHPSVEVLLSDSSHTTASRTGGARSVRPLECPNTECGNRAGVRYEVDYWNLAATKECSAWHGLQEMWAVAPDSAREHYQATAQAINRMRVAQGEPPLRNLRTLTLPRCRR